MSEDTNKYPLNIGDRAIVYKGRKIPKGVEGTVVGFEETKNPYNSNSSYVRVLLALNDKYKETTKDGKTVRRYESVVRVNIENVMKVEPKLLSDVLISMFSAQNMTDPLNKEIFAMRSVYSSSSKKT